MPNLIQLFYPSPLFSKGHIFFKDYCLKKGYNYKSPLIYCFMKNLKVFLLSILGLLFIVLAFTLNWWFITGTVIIMLINQRELMKNSPKTI